MLKNRALWYKLSGPSTPNAASCFTEYFLYTGTWWASNCTAVNPLKGIIPILLARKQTQAANLLAC